MNSTQLDQVALAHFSQFIKQLSFPDIVTPPPSTSAFLYLLPPCLILLAVDLVTQYTNRQNLIANAENSQKDKEEIERLGQEIHQGLVKIRAMDKKLSSEKMHVKYLSRTLQKQRKFMHHRERLHAFKIADSPPAAGIFTESPPQYTASTISFPSSQTETAKPTGIGAPFTLFCERLLFQNKIWKQQRDIKQLQTALSSLKAGGSRNAFQAFCDRLVLTNKLWKQQKEIEGMSSEAEKLKRSQAAAVTRAAKQMVVDVRKERLMEEFVRELISEVEECRQALIKLRAEHEQEIKELVDDCRKDYQRMSKEVERLKLVQDSRMVEQELSNEIENDLVERLSLAESRLDEYLHVPSAAMTDPYANDDGETFSGDELETMSNMSTSTCVGSGGDHSPGRLDIFSDSPRGKHGYGRARVSSMSSISSTSTCVGDHSPSRSNVSSPDGKHAYRRVRVSSLNLKLALRNSAASPAMKSPIARKSDPSAYVGFSFNPLFFRTNDAETDSHSTPDALSSNLSSQQQQKAGPITKNTMPSISGQQPKRLQWRF